MAYGTKYKYQFLSGTGQTCEVQVQQDGYSSGVTDLIPGYTGFEVTWGKEGEDDLTKPLMVSTATLRFVGDSDGEALLDEVFDSPDREYRVRFLVGGSLEWQGFLATDLRKYDPYAQSEIVQLEALDGLAFLENEKHWAGGDSYTQAAAIREVLRSLHDLPIVTSMDWRPYNFSLTAGTCPLNQLLVKREAYQELDDGEVEEELDRRTQIEDILERYGLRLFQAGGEWHVRQRDQIADGTLLKRYRMPTGSLLFNSSTTADITATLPEADAAERPVSGVQRLRSVESCYVYDGLRDLLDNPSFESSDGSLDGWSGSATILDYDNTRVNRNSTQENTYVAKLIHDSTGLGGDRITQEIGALLADGGPRSAMRVEFDVSQPTNNEGNPTLFVDIGFGSYYIQYDVVEVNGQTDEADDGIIPLANPVPGSTGTIVIPEGGTLVGPGKSIVTLTEPARAGDVELHADIPQDFSDGTFLGYYYWSNQTQSYDPGNNYPNQDYDGLLGDELQGIEGPMQTQEIVVPLHTRSGTDLFGKKLSFSVETQLIDALIDKVSVEFLIDEEQIQQTCHIALEDQYGAERELTHRIGSGPSKTHPRRIHGDSTDLLTDWNPDPYNSGESPSGKGLEQLLAEQWMRQRRQSLDRRTYDLQIRGEDVGPQYVYQEDGGIYTFEYLQRQWSTQGDTARVELVEKRDDGITGIEQSDKMEQDSASTGGSGSTTYVGSKTTEGAQDWDGLATKPDSLLIDPTATSDYAETQPLNGGDVTTALGFDPIDPTGDSKDLALGSNKLTFGDGQLQSGSGSYLEVLASDGTSTGELRVDTLNVRKLNVEDLENETATELKVGDKWITVNDGASSDKDGGLQAYRPSAGSDGYMMWDEGSDRWGSKIGSGGSFSRFLQDGDDPDFGTVDLSGGVSLSGSPAVLWTRTTSETFVVRDVTNGNDLIWVTDNGELHAAGEVVANSDGGSTSSTSYSELQILDGGTSLTMDAKFINFGSDLNATVSNGNEITVTAQSGTDFQAGNNLSFDTSTTPKTLDVTGSFYSDSDAVSAVNAETSLSVDISGDADTLDGVDLANISFSDISASRYTDSEARTAVDGANVSITGDADTVDGHNASDFFQQSDDNFLFFNDRGGTGANWRWAVIDGASQLQLDRTDDYGTDYIAFDHATEDTYVSVDFSAFGEVQLNDFEVRDFASLGGQSSGSGVYDDGYRDYIGLIRLTNSGDKEYVNGKITGFRSSFANGGEFQVYAENDPYNDGLNPGICSAYVKARKGGGGARLVQFDYNGYTWIGIEVNAGGSGINRDIHFEGRVESRSGSGDVYPRQIDFGNISNLQSFSGDGADIEEEFGLKTYHGSINLNGKMNLNGDLDFNSNGAIISAGNLNVSSISSNNGSDPVRVTQKMRFNGNGVSDSLLLRVDEDAMVEGKLHLSNESNDWITITPGEHFQFYRQDTKVWEVQNEGHINMVNGNRIKFPASGVNKLDFRGDGDQIYWERKSSESRAFSVWNSTDGNRLFTVQENGNAASAGEMQVNGLSDRRLKKNLTPIASPARKLQRLTGYAFDWKDEAPEYKPDSAYGVVAQEVQRVMPEAIHENNGNLLLDYDQLHALEIEVIKDNRSEIQRLKRENQKLRKKIEEMNT
jgi:hypothetical protein